MQVLAAAPQREIFALGVVLRCGRRAFRRWRIPVCELAVVTV